MAKKRKNDINKEDIQKKGNEEQAGGIPRKMRITIITLVSLLVVGAIGGFIYYRNNNVLVRSDKEITKKEKEVNKEREKVIEDTEKNTGKKIVYYEDVANYVSELENKNGILNLEEKTKKVDNEFGKDTYILYSAGLLPNNRTSALNLEQNNLLARETLEKNVFAGYRYKDVRYKNGVYIEDDLQYNVPMSEKVYLPTTDGFSDVGNGIHAGYPTLMINTFDNTKVALLQVLVYFDEDKKLTSLSKDKFNLKLEGYNSSDYETVNGYNEDELSKELGVTGISSKFGNYLGLYTDGVYGNNYVREKIAGGTSLDNIILAKNGIIPYVVKVDIDENSIDNLKGEQNVEIGKEKVSIKQYVGDNNEENVTYKVVK